jgi:hypothetical protein
MDGVVRVRETCRLPWESVLIAGQEKYSPDAPNMMSFTTVPTPAVSISTRWAHDLLWMSPVGVQRAEAETHRWPSRQMASRARQSPESMEPPPAVNEAGGMSWERTVLLTCGCSVTLAALGVPVIRL